MLNIGLTKLQLDDAVGGEEITLDGEANVGKDEQTAKEVRKSLLTTLRNKFEAGGEAKPDEGDRKDVEKIEEIKTPMVKKARASITASQAVKEDGDA